MVDYCRHVLEGVKHFKAWLAAIWLFERKVEFNPHHFSKLMDIGYATSSAIMMKLLTVLERSMPSDSLEVPSDQFVSVFARRTSETPERLHPRAEEKRFIEARNAQQSLEGVEEHSDMRDSLVSLAVARSLHVFERDYIGPDEKQVLMLLKDEYVHFDSIQAETRIESSALFNCLSMLQGMNAVDTYPGDFYRLSKHMVVGKRRGKFVPGLAVKKKVKGFIRYVETVFQRIGRKYLQKYLAAYWCIVNVELLTEGLFLEACIRSEPISDEEIRAYVSESYLKFA